MQVKLKEAPLNLEVLIRMEQWEKLETFLTEESDLLFQITNIAFDIQASNLLSELKGTKKGEVLRIPEFLALCNQLRISFEQYDFVLDPPLDDENIFTKIIYPLNKYLLMCSRSSYSH